MTDNVIYYYYIYCYCTLTLCLGEAGLFEEAINKYGKDFSDIQKDFVSSHQVNIFPFLNVFSFFITINCIPLFVIILLCLIQDDFTYFHFFLASLEKHLKYH